MPALVVAGGAAGAGRFTFSSRPQLLIEIKVIRSSSLLNMQMILKSGSHKGVRGITQLA
jgi:hypothetical protein